jgi:heavy metal efflux system protein
VFEGDRRFQIVVRLSDAAPGEGSVPATMPLRVLADFDLSDGPNQISRENGKRRVVVTADVRGRDLGSAVAEAQAKVAQKVALPPGYYVTWGGQFENFAAARARLMLVVPVCFALIFLLLLGALGSWRDASSAPCRWRSPEALRRCGGAT